MDVVVIGAGIAGLTCAGELRRRGASVTILERSRGVGGRCATRRVFGQPVDHGLGFLHGDDPRFLAALQAVPEEPLPGWPRRVAGGGPACQPRAFTPGETRMAYRPGVNAFPRHLARELDVRRGATVDAIRASPRHLAVHLRGGEVVPTDRVVVATAFEQALRLLGELGPAADPVRQAAWKVGTLPSYAVIALYEGAPPPDFDVMYPGGDSPLQAIFHDSAKRASPSHLALVLQSMPGFARLRAGRPAAGWAAELLAAAGSLLGPWAAAPVLHQPHAWEFARAAPGGTRAGPQRIEPGSAGSVVFCGETFGLSGGAQSAFVSGLEAAALLL